ncbi:hypothetical protein H4684_002863 [Desulfomicrobium macestii]|uniref:Secreted protein n=1 Tax=Desulfomicrobium macestii TaxID=90731 RepID=A0ABR9H659_9BACT|nr:hypothetical protein [Desulfomicrobium macestii]
MFVSQYYMLFRRSVHCGFGIWLRQGIVFRFSLLSVLTIEAARFCENMAPSVSRVGRYFYREDVSHFKL